MVTLIIKQSNIKEETITLCKRFDNSMQIQKSLRKVYIITLDWNNIKCKSNVLINKMYVSPQILKY